MTLDHNKFDIFKKKLIASEANFKEFKPGHWTTKNRFQMSADSNLETHIQFHLEPTMFEPCLKLERGSL